MYTRPPLKINKKRIAGGADLIRIISTSGSDRGQRDASRPVSRVLYGRGRPRRDGHSSGTPVAGRLEQPTRARRPTDEAPLDARGRQAHRSYSVLLPAGLAVPPTLPPARCALAAPFHPYPQTKRPCGPLAEGGLLSVALSLGSPPPDVIRRRIRMEPGLSSA